MANQEACELYIEQEIDIALKEGKTPYSIGKELSDWIAKLFEVRIKPNTLEVRAHRKKKELLTNVSKESKLPEIIEETPEIIENRHPQGGGKREGAGRPTIRKFNRTNDNIEWAYWTWNPVTGCKHGCKYCYARDTANRFYKEKFEPTFRPERLSAPLNTKIPEDNVAGEHNVFVCSMADLFGDWVPDEWIDKVFKTIEESPKWWNYLFLTKNPKRYLELDFPNRCWIGASGDTQARTDTALSVFRDLKAKGIKNSMFLSCEPLQENISIGEKIPIDWLIIGGRSKSTGMPAGQPEWEWVGNLIYECEVENIPYYMKPNLTVRPKNFPNTWENKQ